MNPILAQKDVHIYRILYSQSELVSTELRNVLDSDECNRADRFYFEEDRLLFIHAHAAKRHILSRYLRIEPSEICFITNQYSKPYIHANDGLQFNLSHTKGCIMFAVSDNHELGIDVENMQRSIEHLPFAHHNYAKSEYEYLQGLPETELAKMFFMFYTRKESYIKALGLGLHLPLDEIPDSVCLQGSDPNNLWEILSFTEKNDFISSIALMQKGLSLNFYGWDNVSLSATALTNIEMTSLS